MRQPPSRNAIGSVNIGSGFGYVLVLVCMVCMYHFLAMSPNERATDLYCSDYVCFAGYPHRIGRIYHHGTRNRNTSLT